MNDLNRLIETGPYSVILADPPWRYNNRTSRRHNKRTKFGGGVTEQYNTMTTREICALPIAQLAADRCMLFLWVTWPHMESGMEVIRAWGFKYIGLGFDWFKTDPLSGKFFFGPGFYAKANSEPCLLARRGRAIKPARDDISSVIVSPRREHSRKPEAARHRIEQMYPSQSKVELFARESRTGWSTFGNQVDEVFATQESLFEVNE